MQKNRYDEIFTEDGTQVPVTVLLMDNVQVVSTRTNNKDGYGGQLGAGSAKVKNVSKAKEAISQRPRLNKTETCRI